MSFFDFSISHAASQINKRNTLMIHQCYFCLAAQKVKWKRKIKSKYLLNSYLRTVHWISQWLSVLSVPLSKAVLSCVSQWWQLFLYFSFRPNNWEELQPSSLTASALAPEPCWAAFRQRSWAGSSTQSCECCFPQLKITPLDDSPILAPLTAWGSSHPEKSEVLTQQLRRAPHSHATGHRIAGAAAECQLLPGASSFC